MQRLTLLLFFHFSFLGKKNWLSITWTEVLKNVSLKKNNYFL